MRIGIEAQRIFRAKKHGMDIVALEMIRSLQKIDKENEYFIYVKPGEDSGCLELSDNFHLRLVKGLTYADWEQLWLRSAMKKDKIDLAHFTSNTAPLIMNIPLVITIHDIIYLEKFSFGGTTYQNLGNLYRKYVVPKVANKAFTIVTVSEFERQTIKHGLQMDDSQVKVVYNGISEKFRPIEDQNLRARVKQEYNLPDRFIFFIGNTAPKKNMKGTIAAYASYRKSVKEPLPLVILECTPEQLAAYAKELDEPELVKHIHLTGYIKHDLLPCLYSMCDLFLYPSYRESFGIPILEGMACGAPVITSNTSSMPEVSGGAAHLVDPNNIVEIADAMTKVLTDNEYRCSLVSKGLHNAQKYTWKNTAEGMLAIYKNLIESN